MSEKILTNVKKLLGVSEEYTAFDIDITTHINSTFLNLNQIGIGPDTGFRIPDDGEYWEDLLLTRKDLDAVKTYMYLKVKLLFDPPQNSYAIEAMKNQIQELEWRLNLQGEKGV